MKKTTLKNILKLIATVFIVLLVGYFAFWSCRGVDAKYGKLMLKTFLKQKARVFFRAFFSQIK